MRCHVDCCGGSKEWRAAEHAGHDLMIYGNKWTSESTTWSTSFGKSYKKANANVIMDKLCCQERLKKQFSFDGGRRSLSSNHSTPADLVTKISRSMSSVFMGTRPKNHIQSPKSCTKSQQLWSPKVDFWLQRIWKMLKLSHHEAFFSNNIGKEPCANI